MSKNINDITLFRYLFNLDKRDLPKSILRWFEDIGNTIDEDRKNAVEELLSVKNNCKNLVLFSKEFVQTLDDFHNKCDHNNTKILETIDDENGIVRSPYFIDGCYVVYKVKNNRLTLWVFHDNISYITIPTYYIRLSPKYDNEPHQQLDYKVIQLLDYCTETNIQDYIDMVLDYISLKVGKETKIVKNTTIIKRLSKKGNKKQMVSEPGLDYFIIDCV
jgi:hypothetical protein